VVRLTKVEGKRKGSVPRSALPGRL
jgi:hypothetical protein